jgi:hypothetical protein
VKDAPMYASISTWHLDESIRDEAAYEDFVGSVLNKALPTSRELGILDALLVRVADDTFVAVTVFDSAEAADAVWQQAIGPQSILYSEKITLVNRVTGHAVDMPELTVGGLD